MAILSLVLLQTSTVIVRGAPRRPIVERLLHRLCMALQLFGVWPRNTVFRAFAARLCTTNRRGVGGVCEGQDVVAWARTKSPAVLSESEVATDQELHDLVRPRPNARHSGVRPRPCHPVFFVAVAAI